MRVLIITACLLSLTTSIRKLQLQPLPFQPQDKPLQTKMMKAQLKNHKDILYTMEIEIGTPPQKNRVQFDTGSNILWVSSPNCTSCQKAPRFQFSNSSTFKNLTVKKQLNYVGGVVSGVFSEDVAKFGGRQAQQIFVLVDKVDQTFKASNSKYSVSGIIGFGRVDNLLSQILYGVRFIDTGHFAIELGWSKLNQPSYLYYNLNKNDFPTAKYFKIPRFQPYWSILIDKFQANTDIYYPQSFVVDSGSTHSMFKKQLFKQLNTKYFQPHCEPFNKLKPQKYRSCDCDFSKYPTFKLTANLTTVQFSPFMYIAEYQGVCLLTIQPTRSNTDPNLLGDQFIRHYTVVFDNYGYRIGFIQRNKDIRFYVAETIVLVGLRIVYIVVILVVALIFCTGKHQLLSEDKNNSQKVFQMGTGVMIG